MPSYIMRYEYQTCFDDGGLGHDSWWQKSNYTFEAENDEEALKIANEDLAKTFPCKGSFCDNKGGKRLIQLVQEDVIVRSRTIA